jgi:hypothetical protein
LSVSYGICGAAYKGFCDPIGAREPRLAECFDFPFDVIFDAANRERGAIDQEV